MRFLAFEKRVFVSIRTADKCVFVGFFVISNICHCRLETMLLATCGGRSEVAIRRWWLAESRKN
jgi:hypothetical protein